MDAPDGQVPAPRRPALPFRRPAPSASPTGLPAELPFAVPGEQTPRVADLSALLADIDALRLTLQTDLSLAAAALDEGAQDLAAELVDGDLFELRAFAARAGDRLGRLEAAAAEPELPVDELAVVSPLRKRRILSAGPLMAAAAALVGFAVFGPSRATSAPETSMTSAAEAGYELSRLASEGATDEALREAAEELNDELAVLIAQAADDPAAAQQALLLLEKTAEVLEGQGDSGVLRSVMAETRALRERLRETLPSVTKRPVRNVVRPAVPAMPRVQVEQEKERSSSSAPKSSPKPAASPKPSPAAASPAPAPAPSEAPKAPAGEPTPQPTQQPGPLPAPDDLPGA